MFKSLASDRQVLLFCDFHGHSNIKDVIFYGCDEAESHLESENNEADSDSDDEEEADFCELKGVEVVYGKPVLLQPNFSWSSLRSREKLFPALCFKRLPQFFNLDKCSFRVSPSKAGASRVAMWKELNLIHSFTLEASFCGPSSEEIGNVHFDTSDFEQIGKSFCLAVYDLFTVDQNTCNSLLNELKSKRKNSFPTASIPVEIKVKKKDKEMISSSPPVKKITSPTAIVKKPLKSKK